MAEIPKCKEKFYDAMAMWEDGTLVLCASCLTGKYWSGSVWCFRSFTDVATMEKCITGVETDSGPCDVVSLGQDKILIGLDTGAIEILALERDSDPLILSSQFYSAEHDDLITSVDVLSDGCKGISSSLDYSIKVWDFEAFCSVGTFRPAHGSSVNQVSSCPINPNLFLSCGEDYKLKLWDLRAGYKACIGNTVINSESFPIVPTAVSWKPDSLIYAVGCENGQIMFGDLRNMPEVNCNDLIKTFAIETEQSIFSTHSRCIRRLKFNRKKPQWLASCSDTNEVIVTDISNLDSPVNLFKDSSHEHCVRDILWDFTKDVENHLLSCSWDTSVHLNEIKQDPEMDIGDI